VDQISSGAFPRGDVNLFKPLIDSLLHGDLYVLFADYRSYVERQELLSLAYQDQTKWTRMSILNVAGMGKFSSDRSIGEYCDKPCKARPITVELGKYTIG
jgi:starch phosphorylase